MMYLFMCYIGETYNRKRERKPEEIETSTTVKNLVVRSVWNVRTRPFLAEVSSADTVNPGPKPREKRPTAGVLRGNREAEKNANLYSHF